MSAALRDALVAYERYRCGLYAQGAREGAPQARQVAGRFHLLQNFPPEAMDWCERNGVRYVFGLSKNSVLDAKVFAKTDEVCARRATANLDVLRDFTEVR